MDTFYQNPSIFVVVLQVVSDSLWCHRLQNTRLPSPSPSLRVCPNSCPLNWWCHPITSSSVTFFSFRLQSFPASGSFPMSQLFLSGGQTTGASASASILPVSIQGWLPLGSPCCPTDSQESSLAPQFESISSSALCLFMVQLSHLYMTMGKTIALTIWIFVVTLISLLLNTQPRLATALLPSSNRLLPNILLTQVHLSISDN